MDRRARLHRALDVVIDKARARDVRAGNIEYKPHEFKQDPYKTAKICFVCGNSMNNPYANHIGAVPDKRSGPREDVDRMARLHCALDVVMDGVMRPMSLSTRNMVINKMNRYKKFVTHHDFHCPARLDPNAKCSPECDVERAKAKDAAQYEVRKSRGNDAWAVFKIGDDFPVTSWTNSKAAAMIDARHLNGGTVKVRPKSQETAAREVAKRTELNPVVRNYFKLDN